jgi:MerR family transcriptional regulator, light-induced transcriptional regulator
VAVLSSDEGGRVPISEASRLLGVPMPTLRSWEARYGIPGSDHAIGKHRSYSEQELHALRMMRDEIGRGLRAGLAAQAVRALLGIQGPARECIDRLLSASDRGDAEGLRAELSQAAALLGPAGCIDEVVFPAMKQIGLWWESGHCDVEQERFTSETVRGWLDGLAARAPAPIAADPVVLACGPSDQHTIGMEALALLLRLQQRPCRVLGARVAIPALVTAARANNAPAVVLVCHLNSGRQRAIRAIRAVNALPTAVFYAGNGFSSPRSRRNVPGRYLGTRVRQACADLLAVLDAPPTGPLTDLDRPD